MKNSRELALKKAFPKILLKWNREKNTRKMPWKAEKDPYKIWLSEIILQQTRVEQGLPYYQRFIKAFPDIHSLAGASDERIFKHWEGLGYYSRCRNLIHTARLIARDRNGVFPNTYEEIRSLKGIGPYTAAAIASFAYGLPYAVVDGNVFRVLARIFGISIATDSQQGKQVFSTLAGELLDPKHAGEYNQAIMDFGAVICKPMAPLCNECVLQKHCHAYRLDRVAELPVKQKKLKIRKRWFYYFVLHYRNKWAIQKREAKDIWQDLYEFPLLESAKPLDQGSILRGAVSAGLISEAIADAAIVSVTFRQQLSHQLVAGCFIRITLKNKPSPGSSWIWINRDAVREYAFPKFIHLFLQQAEK